MAPTHALDSESPAPLEDVHINQAHETTPLVPIKAYAGGKDHLEELPFPLDQSEFLSSLNTQFGWKLLMLLFAAQHLVKGFGKHFIDPATQFLFAEYKLQGPRMQVFSGIVSLPWAMKPIIGLLSDCFPLFGYNKGPYMFIYSVVGVAACGLVAHGPSFMTVECAAIFIFLIQLQVSACDLLAEAKYAEKMQDKPAHGPDLMAYVWFGLQAGGLLATLLIGPLLQNFGVKAVYAGAVLPLSFILLPIVWNCLEERPKSAEEASEARRKMFEQKEACFLCVVMFISTIILTILGIAYESVYVNCFASITVALLMLVAFSVLLRPIIAKSNAFFLMQSSLAFHIGGASFYFYTDGPEQYAAGPHFSKQFFTSVLGTVGAVCSLVGIYMYQRYMRDWKYTNLLLMTNLVLSALSALDVMMYSRLNVRWGIPDHVFVMGASVFQIIISQWMWMPGVVLTSQLCPKGMEATMYALLAGCHNLGSTIGASTGAVVLDLFGCKPSGAKNEDHQFDNLWIASVLNTLLPMLTLLLLPWLIPDAKQTDKLLDDADRDATSGSLWRRFWQQQ